MYHAALIGTFADWVRRSHGELTLLMEEYIRDTLHCCREWHFFNCKIFLQILATNLHECRELIKLSLSNAAENFTTRFSFILFPLRVLICPSVKH